MADQQQHMTFVERFRMQPDVAAALIEWREARKAFNAPFRLADAEAALMRIASRLPGADHPSIKMALEKPHA